MGSKKWVCWALVLGIVLSVPVQIRSAIKPSPVIMGTWNTLSSNQGSVTWECYAWKENPILIDSRKRIEIVLLDPVTHTQTIDSSTGIIRIASRENSNCQFQVKTVGITTFRCRYTSPNQAMVDFAGLYNRLAIPWQKRLYHQNRLDSLHPTTSEYNPTLPQAGEQITGAPYVWGGKQSLAEIIRKLTPYPAQQSWLSVRLQYPEISGVNLDEGESAWDSPKGSEYPPQWCGLDCSGLVEQCARYAGLRYNWPQAPLIASGNYQGIDYYEKIQPGDVIMILKKGILVHFGIVSKKGSSVRTTKMVHTVWFTNYRLHHNSVLKTIETSLSELSNLYEYQFIRLSPW